MCQAQTSLELFAFERFARCAPIEIKPASVRKRLPPEPDILCEVSAGQSLAFELVEIVDSGLARRGHERDRAEQTLRRAIAADTQQARDFRGRFHDAVVFVRFGKQGGRRHLASIGPLFDFLVSLPKGFEGDFSHRQLGPMLDGVTWLHVTRDAERTEAELQVDTVGSITTPVLKAVNQKWRKNYITSHRIELLAYFGVQPMGLIEVWAEELTSFVNDNWEASPYQRVWICDLGQPQVLWQAERPTSTLRS